MASTSLLASFRTLRLAATAPGCSACSTVLARAYATAADASTPASSSSESPSWSPYSQRTGVIARKRGMSSIWDDKGVRVPVTVLQLEDLQVVAHTPPAAPKPNQPAPYSSKPLLHALQLGSTNHPRPKRLPSQVQGQFKKADVPAKRKIIEFRVTEDAVLPVGTTLSAAHFVPGQHVDISGDSIGKGFAGAMKRHGFAGLKASHGVSLTHRSAGSTGQHQDPGRVIPGKKMAGHMGTTRTTVQNLPVVRVDTALNLIFVKGCIPGFDDAYVEVKDSKKKVRWAGMKAVRKGKQEGEWLEKSGVAGLPFPAGTTEQSWPEVIQMATKA